MQRDGVSGPAYDDRAIAAAGRDARRIWYAESAELRDAISKLSIAGILAALDDEEIRVELAPHHRGELQHAVARASKATQAPSDRQHVPVAASPVPTPPRSRWKPAKADWPAHVIRYGAQAAGLIWLGLLARWLWF
jgi:hypothetical protein